MTNTASLQQAAYAGEERRNVHRRRLLRSGTISPNGRDTVFDCVLRNLSDGGAKVRVVSQIGIPKDFVLTSPEEGLSKVARIVWRDDKEIGVKFA